MLRALCFTAGIWLLFFALVACGFSLLAILDPAGTQMADDGNPWGQPPSRLILVAVLCVYAGIGVAGAFLIHKALQTCQLPDPAQQ